MCEINLRGGLLKKFAIIMNGRTKRRSHVEESADKITEHIL
jgi:hypothetical protein